MKNLFFILLSFLSLSSYSQNLRSHQIKLTDSLLKKELFSFIDSVENTNDEFRQYGYIEVSLLYMNNEAINKDLKLKYRIKDQYYSLNKNSNFPLYYTYVKDRLILLYNLLPNNLSNPKLNEKTKRKWIKKINKTLRKPEHVIAKDSSGNVIINDKNFIDDSFNIHGGETLYIYNNGKVKTEKNMK